MQFDESFSAMGTEVDVVIEAASPPIDAFLSVRLLFERQEARFSRFRQGSLLTQLNRGQAVDDAAFATGCRLALEAHGFTGGAFNPMVLPALRDAGYDRTFELLAGGHPREQQVPDPAECIAIDGNCVHLRSGALDLGGLVKGWTVDLAIDLLRDCYDGVLVNAGGDMRTSGSEDGGSGWSVEVERPMGGVAWEGRLSGALATSTTLRRRWITDGGSAHHLIDPGTGLPAGGPIAQVSVWGRETWRAESWAKAILIDGETAACRARVAGFEVLALAHDGTRFFDPPSGTSKPDCELREPLH